jgi:DNA-binding transcriptional ArsR family regulator
MSDEAAAERAGPGPATGPAAEPATEPVLEAAAGESAEAPEPASTIHLDAKGLRVLAHPLRAQLLITLRLEGPATATTLAGALGTNTGATSYHLRQLADVGLVVETGDRRGRQRWWRAATEMHSWTARDVADDPDGQAASAWLRGHYLRIFVDRYERWLVEEASWPLPWQEASESGDWMVRVTPDRLTALNAELEEVIMRYRDPDPADPRALPVQVYLHSFPSDAASGKPAPRDAVGGAGDGVTDDGGAGAGGGVEP